MKWHGDVARRGTRTWRLTRMVTGYEMEELPCPRNVWMSWSTSRSEIWRDWSSSFRQELGMMSSKIHWCYFLHSSVRERDPQLHGLWHWLLLGEFRQNNAMFLGSKDCFNHWSCHVRYEKGVCIIKTKSLYHFLILHGLAPSLFYIWAQWVQSLKVKGLQANRNNYGKKHCFWKKII